MFVIVLRLDRVNLSHVVNVEPEKIYQLAGGIDFRLLRRLALTKHCGRIQYRPVFCGQ
jgi:hypothetical protein